MSKNTDGLSTKKVNKPKKAKKRIVYGEYSTKRKDPLYLAKNEYKKGLTQVEVDERKENLQVNIEGVVESNFTKTLKTIFKVFVKNTFTFFNILYVIVLLLLLLAKQWNSQYNVGSSFGFTDFLFLAIVIVNLAIIYNNLKNN